jgi:hypothetical protein
MIQALSCVPSCLSTIQRCENLWSYAGFAELVNVHVICVRPTVLDLRIGWLGAIRPSGMYHDRTRDRFNETHFDTPIVFRCYLTVPRGAEDWPISRCAVGSATGSPRSPARFPLQVNTPFRAPTLKYVIPQVAQPRP